MIELVDFDVESRNETVSGPADKKPKRATRRVALKSMLTIENNGEPWRARTSDPLIKSQLLYQLS